MDDYEDVGGGPGGGFDAAAGSIGLRALGSDVAGNADDAHGFGGKPGVDLLFQGGCFGFDALEDFDLVHVGVIEMRAGERNRISRTPLSGLRQR